MEKVKSKTRTFDEISNAPWTWHTLPWVWTRRCDVVWYWTRREASKETSPRWRTSQWRTCADWAPGRERTPMWTAWSWSGPSRRAGCGWAWTWGARGSCARRSRRRRWTATRSWRPGEPCARTTPSSARYASGMVGMLVSLLGSLVDPAASRRGSSARSRSHRALIIVIKDVLKLCLLLLKTLFGSSKLTFKNFYTKNKQPFCSLNMIINAVFSSQNVKKLVNFFYYSEIF